MSYHELEAEVMRVRGLLAAALEENATLKTAADKAWSAQNWKQRECDDLRERLNAREAEPVKITCEVASMDLVKPAPEFYVKLNYIESDINIDPR